MARNIAKIKQNCIASITGLYRISSYGASSNSFSVDELQRLIESLFSEFNRGSQAWNDLITLKGISEARALLLNSVDQVPDDIAAVLADVRVRATAIVDLYQSTYGVGTPNRTFNYDSTGLFTGGFEPVQVPAEVVTEFNALCQSLLDSVGPLTPLD